MSRPRTIDLDRVLTAAEDLLTDTGGLYFTLDQVAEKAGVSKGAITNAYPSKSELVNALLTREFDRFRKERADYHTARSGFPLTEAHIAVSEVVADTYKTRAARLIAALAHELHHLETIRDLYAGPLQEADGQDEAARKARLAFFAIEGAFLMRGLGMVEMGDAEWQMLFADALDLLPSA